MNIVEKAVAFATDAHRGQTRKNAVTPYILHPVEAAAVAASLTDDQEVIAAVVLHDTVEDTDVTVEDIRGEFGDRVAELVAGETEELFTDVPRDRSWMVRKEHSLKKLESAPRDVKIMWLSDKLSNMRSFSLMFDKEGDAMWNHFNQKDKDIQRWYYRSVAEGLKELSDTVAYREYMSRFNTIFGEEQ